MMKRLFEKGDIIYDPAWKGELYAVVEDFNWYNNNYTVTWLGSSAFAKHVHQEHITYVIAKNWKKAPRAVEVLFKDGYKKD